MKIQLAVTSNRRHQTPAKVSKRHEREEKRKENFSVSSHRVAMLGTYTQEKKNTLSFSRLTERENAERKISLVQTFRSENSFRLFFSSRFFFHLLSRCCRSVDLGRFVTGQKRTHRFTSKSKRNNFFFVFFFKLSSKLICRLFFVEKEMENQIESLRKRNENFTTKNVTFLNWQVENLTVRFIPVAKCQFKRIQQTDKPGKNQQKKTTKKSERKKKNSTIIYRTFVSDGLVLVAAATHDTEKSNFLFVRICFSNFLLFKNPNNLLQTC